LIILGSTQSHDSAHDFEWTEIESNTVTHGLPHFYLRVYPGNYPQEGVNGTPEGTSDHSVMLEQGFIKDSNDMDFSS
jgi:hypothetical protein